MGYANPDQRGSGIHLRQFARTFIIDDGTKKLVFVNTDAGMMGTGVRKIVSLYCFSVISIYKMLRCKMIYKYSG